MIMSYVVIVKSPTPHEGIGSVTVYGPYNFYEAALEDMAVIMRSEEGKSGEVVSLYPPTFEIPESGR
jgi:hypothetical protein